MATAKHVLILGIDGLPAAIPAPYSLDANLPALHALASRNGIWSDQCRSVFPSDSYPNWTSLFTSTEPHIHGIDSNNHVRTRPVVSSTEGERHFMPHVFSVIRRELPDAALGAFYTWVGFNEILKPDDCFTAKVHGRTDPNTTKEVIEFVGTLKDAPSSCVFVHLDDVDEDCHAAGYHASGTWEKALKRTNDECSAILNAYREVGIADRDDFLVIVCSDHGRDDSGKHHGFFTNSCLTTRLILSSPAFKSIAGPASSRVFTTRPITITDIAPTILFALGLDVPLQFRGHALREAWGQETRKVLDREMDTEATKGWEGVPAHRSLWDHDHYRLGVATGALCVLGVQAALYLVWVGVRLWRSRLH